MSLFSAVELAPRDPILGLNEAFNADPRTDKVNLGWASTAMRKAAFRCCGR